MIGYTVIVVFVASVGFLIWKGTGSLQRAIVGALVLSLVATALLAILLH